VYVHKANSKGIELYNDAKKLYNKIAATVHERARITSVPLTTKEEALRAAIVSKAQQ